MPLASSGFFFFQAEDGIRDHCVTGVQTCALPICAAGVRTRLVRRDGAPNSDYVEVIFDTYHDHIGRLFFTVNPSGVRGDANGLGGGSDDSWDPVWEVKTAIDSLGWTAEMRIPLSQLRYPATAEIGRAHV